MHEVVIQAVGFAMEEALLVRWLKEPGDAVTVGEALADIETDKAVVELEAPASGVLGAHRFLAGTTVAVGVALTTILDGLGGSDPPPSAPPVAEQVVDARRLLPALAAVSNSMTTVIDERPRHQRSPRQRAAAIAAAVVTGDRVIAVPVPTHGATSTARLSGFTMTREIMADALLEIRASRLRAAVAVPTATDLFVSALARALHVLGRPDPIDIGLAVSIPGGVAVAVLRDVRRCSTDEVSAARSDAVERSRAGRLSPSESDRPPIATLADLGTLDVDGSSAAAGAAHLVLTVGRVARRVVVVGDAIAVRPTFFASVDADLSEITWEEAANLLKAFADAVVTIGELDSRTTW